nr:reverse transcriptase domain-containing protein [Tanacetum cinerariifolium]
RSEKVKEGVGYNVVPPPAANLYLSPKKDLSWTGLPEFVDDTVTDYSRPSPTIASTSSEDQNKDTSTSKEETPKKPQVKYFEQNRQSNKRPKGNQRNWNNLKSYQLGPEFVLHKKPCFNYGDFSHLAKDCRRWVQRETNRSQNHSYKSSTFRPAGHRPHGPSMNPRKPTMNGARTYKTFFQTPSFETRPFLKSSAVNNSYRAPWVPTVNRNFPTGNRKFPTASRKFSTGSTKFSTADMGMKGKAGIDFMGPFPSSKGNKYILVAVDYLSKWVESKALPTNDARVVVKFLKSLFSRSRTPKAIISDGGTHFCNDQFSKVMSKYGVTHRLFTAYHPQTNEQVEVTNRGLKRILKKTVGENRALWIDKLEDALWAFRTDFKTPISCTPYRLVYGKLCHLPLELEHKAFWALKHANFDLKTAGDHRKLQLNELRELRDQAYENSLIYKERTKKLHDANVKNQIFNVGDQVLLFNSRLKIFSGKLKSRWSGPFTISEVYPYGTAKLVHSDGSNFKVNCHRLKHYHGGDTPPLKIPDFQTFPKDN